MTQLHQLINQQLEQVKELNATSQTLAEVIASETWEAFEAEVEKLTEDGIYWDFAPMLKQSLKLELGFMFDEKCEIYFNSQLDELSEQLQSRLNEHWQGYDCLASIKKGWRLNKYFKEQIDALFTHSKPGFFSQLSRLVIDDLDYVLEHQETDAHKDAQKLRNNFYKAGNKFTEQLTLAAKQIINKACHQYSQALQTQLNKQAA